MGSSILFNRYELKYWVPEETTADMARFIAPYVELDPFSARSPDRQYTITSLYFDSPRWGLFQACAAGITDRYKLRIRTYGDRSEGPITTEVKRKVKDVVVKSRAFIAPRETYPAVLEDPSSQRPDFASPEERSYYDEWICRMIQRQAGPRMLVRYTREAYESPLDAYVRVTIDRKIEYQPADGFDLRGDPRAWIALDSLRETGERGFASVEIKVESVFPCWIHELIRRFELRLDHYSKYVWSVLTEREERYGGRELDFESLVEA